MLDQQCAASTPSPPPPDIKQRVIFRNNKHRNSDIVRRFSETQVFRHHKEKYLKQKENEGKYNSCPVPASPDAKIETASARYIKAKGFVKRVSSMLTPTSRPRVLIRKSRDSFGSTWSINFDSSSSEVRLCLFFLSLLVSLYC